MIVGMDIRTNHLKIKVMVDIDWSFTNGLIQVLAFMVAVPWLYLCSLVFMFMLRDIIATLYYLITRILK